MMLSRTVGSLVEAGLLERTSDPTYRRAALVSVTANGRKLIERVRRERDRALSAALDPTRCPCSARRSSGPCPRSRRSPSSSGSDRDPRRQKPAGSRSRPWAIPNYRRYISGQAISLIGTWMQMTAQSGAR